MGIRQVLICVREHDYARRLAEYFSQQRKYLFRVHYCDDLEMGHHLARTVKPEYILIDEAFSAEERRGFGSGRRFILTENAEAGSHIGTPGSRAGMSTSREGTPGGANQDGTDAEIPIFKYRSGKEILETMVRCSLDDAKLIIRDSGERVTVVGFFSPVNRIGQTGLALEVGRQLARNDSALYLNLCSYAGGHFSETENPTLAELLYFLEQDMPNIGLRLKTLTSQTEGLDYLNPMTSAADLQEVEPATWKKLIDALREHASYGVILLDIGCEVRGVYGILEECDQVLMPVLAGRYEEEKVEAFSNDIRQSEKAAVLKKIRKVPMERELPKIVDSCVKLIAAEGDFCEFSQ